jgi:hypothetical protein
MNKQTTFRMLISLRYFDRAKDTISDGCGSPASREVIFAAI